MTSVANAPVPPAGVTPAAPVIEGFAGEVLRPGDGGYHAARRLYNRAIDRHPALIARCTGVADVIAAVRHARRRGLRVAVYGGGHSFAGHSVCDDGLVIDLRPMKGVRADPTAAVVHAQAGLTWGELDRETQVFGLAVTGGRDPSTGIVGLTLGSGSGWLERPLGRSCDNLRSADLVTADGKFLTASATEHSELFWGLRGGGGNFGIVTALEYQLHRVGPVVLGGMLLYPRDRASEVLRFWREFIAAAPDEVAGVCILNTVPDAPFVPEQVRGRPVAAVVACYLGPPAAGEKVLRPLRGFGRPTADLIAPLPYTALQQLAAPSPELGDRFYATFDFLPELSDECIDVLAAQTPRAGGLQAIVVPFGGAVARLPEDATAFGHRSERFGLNILAQWADPGEDARHTADARTLARAMRAYTAGGGVYLNGNSDDDPGVVKAAFGPTAYRRLVALKDRYDPGNVFRLNHNIPPSTTAANTGKEETGRR